MTNETARPTNVGSGDQLSVVAEARCMCKDRALSACPGEWEPGCDLGANEKFVRVADTTKPAMKLTEAEVNHLRRLLAWMRCEWMLDDDMQLGYLQGTAATVALGMQTPEQAGTHLVERAEKINRCPAYVRQAVKMLTKAIRDHERAVGVVDA